MHTDHIIHVFCFCVSQLSSRNLARWLGNKSNRIAEKIEKLKSDIETLNRNSKKHNKNNTKLFQEQLKPGKLGIKLGLRPRRSKRIQEMREKNNSQDTRKSMQSETAAESKCKPSSLNSYLHVLKCMLKSQNSHYGHKNCHNKNT